MSRLELNEYKKERRNRTRIKTRESLFITEYMETKYHHIYMEAAPMYNSLNEKYPRKPDLRRTAEFRTWKNVAKPKSFDLVPRKKYGRPVYESISLKEIQPLTMQLEIPLSSSHSPTRQSSVKEYQTDEILQEGDQPPPVQQDISNIEPSLSGEVTPQVIEKIIQELRDDPEMNELMQNVEEQIEEEELMGLDVDLPEIPDPLGEELSQLW